jgi:hypothetical protein
VAGFFLGCAFFLTEFNFFLNHVADDLYTYGFQGRPGAEGVDNCAGHAPFLAVLAAYAVTELLGWLGRRPLGQRRAVVPLTAAVLLVLLLVPPLVTAVRYDVENTRRDTGSYAREWIDRTFPPGTHFALERHTPILDWSRYKIT